MKKLMLVVVLMLAIPFAHAGGNGIIKKKSLFSPKVTMDKFEAVLKKKGIGVVTRWSHHEKAKAVGIPLRSTELIIFGNPKLGSNFFTSKQSSGIDLPMKVLVWEDAKGDVWLAYNDPQYIADRHNIKDRADVIKKMSGALNKLSDKAVK